MPITSQADEVVDRAFVGTFAKKILVAELPFDHDMVPTMIDTCASMNLASQEYLDENGIPFNTTNYDPTILGGIVANSNVSTIGTVDLYLSLPIGPTVVTFHVIPILPCPFASLIIGFPDFRRLSIDILSSSDSIMIGKPALTLPLQTQEQVLKVTQEVPAEVRLKKDIKIPPGTSVFVKFYSLSNYFKYNNEAVITPSQALRKAYHLKLLTGVIKESTKFVLLANLSHDNVSLKKGTLIGHLTSGQFEIYALDAIDDSATYLPIEEPEWTYETFAEKAKPLISDNLNEEQSGIFLRFLQDWRKIFSLNPKSPGTTTKTQAHVPLLPGTMPMRLKPYRASLKAVDELKRQINEMVQNKIIRKSSSPWAFPVVLAIKADGTWRFCIDYSKLTAYVKRDAFTLPRIDDYLDRLKDAKFITVIDLASGFWQIPVKEEDREILAFSTPFGNYEPNVLPFGFTNSPSIFQAAISETLDFLLYLCCLVYIDDIAIYSSTFDQHLEDCEKTFTRLDAYGWKAKLEKCQFACKSVNYLGHNICDGEVRPLQRNIDKLKTMKPPKTPDEIVSFLGFMGYYKRFIQGYDYITQPLRALTKHGAVWKWGQEQEDAYNKLLELLSSSPILKLPDYSRPFIVKADTSQLAWGAALVQVYDGQEFPVSFASGNLNVHQREWPTWKRECFGVIQAINHWKHYLLGTHFTIVTDHQSLLSILDLSKKHPPIIIGWVINLSMYDYDIVHRPGKFLVIEDALSRPTNTNPENSFFLCPNDVIKHQKEDPLCSQIRKHIEEDTPFSEELVKKIGCYRDSFLIEDDALFYLDTIPSEKKRRFMRLVIPEVDINEILTNLHTLPIGGHLGFKRLFESFAREYWTPHLFERTKKFFKSCEVCTRNRLSSGPNAQPLHVTATVPLEVIEVDHMEMKVPSNGNYYILTVVDIFTKKVWFIPSKTTSAAETFELLLAHVFTPNRFCKKFISDRGSAFVNELVNYLGKATGIVFEYNLPRQVEKGATAAVENKNRLGWSILRKLVDPLTQTDWSIYCWTAAYAYNKSPNPQLDNYSPDDLFHGLQPFSIVEFHTLDTLVIKDENLNEQRQRFEKAWTKARDSVQQYLKSLDAKTASAKYPTYAVDDLVLLKNRPDWTNTELRFKLATRTLGPFPILEVIPDRNHLLLSLSSTQTMEVHVDNVTKFDGKIPQSKFLFKPGEIITQPVPFAFPEDDEGQFMKLRLPDTEKAKYTVTSIVGKHVAVYWNEFKRYYLGFVIGYVSTLKANLITFATRTIDANTKEPVDPREDFYKIVLFGKKPVKWFLIKV